MKNFSVSELVSRALVMQVGGSGAIAGSGTAAGPENRPIALDLVEALASIGCTLDEIGKVVGVSKRTLIRREKEWPFRAAINRGRGRGQVMLRLMQMKGAKKGNTTTLILLGKRMLGQQSFEDGAGKNADTAVPPLKTQKTSESGVPGRVVGTEVREQPARQGNAGTAELQEEPQKSAAAAGKRTK